MEWWARALLQAHLWWKKVKKQFSHNTWMLLQQPRDICVPFNTEQTSHISQNWYSRCHSERWRLIHSHPSFNRQKPPSSGLYENPTSVWIHTHTHTWAQVPTEFACRHTHEHTCSSLSYHLPSPPSSTRHPFSVPLQLHVEGFNPGDTTLLLKRGKRDEED